MQILYLAHRIPYPPDKGDKLRAFKQLQHLAKNHRVFCACFVDNARDFTHVAALDSICHEVAPVPLGRHFAAIRGLLGWTAGSTITETYYREPAMHAVLRNWSNATTFDSVVAFSSSMAPYALAVPAARHVLDLCDLDSRKWTDYARFSNSIARAIYRREGLRLARREHAWIDAFDATVLITAAEAEPLGRPVAERVHIIGNGVDLPPLNDRSRLSPLPLGEGQGEGLGAIDQYRDRKGAAHTPPPQSSQVHADLDPNYAEPPTIQNVVGFMGTMDYFPNIDAVCWFVQRCWPDIREACPNAVFCVVGRAPARSVRRLASTPGVEVTGKVPDAAAAVQSFQVSVAPLRIARGLQNKVLEAMAAARPVVLSPAAAAGIAAEHQEHFLVANTAEETIAHVVRLLKDPAERSRLGTDARCFVAKHHRWEDQLLNFERIVTGNSRTIPHRSGPIKSKPIETPPSSPLPQPALQAVVPTPK